MLQVLLRPVAVSSKVCGAPTVASPSACPLLAGHQLIAV